MGSWEIDLWRSLPISLPPHLITFTPELFPLSEGVPRTSPKPCNPPRRLVPRLRPSQREGEIKARPEGYQGGVVLSVHRFMTKAG
jgi:hypothetical protein